MVAFGLIVKDDEATSTVMSIRKNLLVDNILKNPFNGKITAHGKDFFSVILEPVYPKVYLFSFFPLLISILTVGHWYGYVAFYIGLVMLCMRVFWTNTLYFLLFYIKTKGKVRYVSARETLRRVV